MPDPSTKIPPPCEDCGGYHTEAEHEAFHAAQGELRKQIVAIIDEHGEFFDSMIARLQLATPDMFEHTAIVAMMAHYLMTRFDVPEDTFNRCLDALIDASDENPWMKLVAGKKVADA